MLNKETNKFIADNTKHAKINYDKANELIKLKRIDEFKKSVANGTHEEFLANISWIDKSSLKVDMGLARLGLSNEKDLTEEEQKYYDIIENSINKDLEKEALSQGFDSVEAWKNHNAMCTESVETWRDYNAKCTESATVLLH